MSAGRIGSAAVKGVLSKLRSAGSARAVAQQAARPANTLSMDDLIRSQNLREEVQEVSQSLSGLRDALRIERSGARNVNRARLLRQIAQEEARAGRFQAVAARAGAQRQTLASGGLDSLNRQWDRAEELRRRWSRAARNPSDAKRVVNFQGEPELGIPPMRGTPKQIADRMQKVKDDLERQGARTKRSLANRERTEMRAIDKSLSAQEARERLLGRLDEVGPERIVDQNAVSRIQAQITEREAVLGRLTAPTQTAAQEAVEQTAAEAAPKGMGKVRKGLLYGAGGVGGFFGVSTAIGAFQERAENEVAGDRLASMIRGAADQRLEMLRAMAAMQRIQQGARQNLANLAMQQPHVFNEIMAGRQLAPGVVSIGGNRQEQMMRMAEVGSAMATGQFNGMGSPDALGLLAQYMQQG